MKRFILSDESSSDGLGGMVPAPTIQSGMSATFAISSGFMRAMKSQSPTFEDMFHSFRIVGLRTSASMSIVFLPSIA